MIGRIPMDDGKYDCQIQIDGLDSASNAMPGMGCKLSFLVHENDQALMVPKASVFSDDGGIMPLCLRGQRRKVPEEGGSSRPHQR